MKECKLCGKIEDTNWCKHFKKFHNGRAPVEVKPGEYADAYRFAMKKETVNFRHSRTIYEDLKPWMGLEDKHSLIAYTMS